MEDAREEAFRRAVQGHSFLLTGQRGTGKTHLLRRIIKEITDRQKRVTAVTASTGMASLQLGVGGLVWNPRWPLFPPNSRRTL